MTVHSIDRAKLRQPGSVILAEFKAAMELQRAAGGARGPNFGTARPGIAQAARSFQVAEANAFTAGFTYSTASINALLRNSLPVLVARSRQWSRNTGAGRRFLNQVKNGAVGPVGYTLQMRCGDWRLENKRWVWRLDKLANDAIEREWLKWCKRGNCEASGRLSFADVCKLQMETAARDGAYLARHLRGTKANAWNYQLQLLSPDRLDIHHNEPPAANGADVVMGVHRNDAGRPLAYSILRHNPGDWRGNGGADVVPAAEVLHDFVSLDPEQARGVPWSHAILLGSNMLAQFQQFAVYAAQAGASQMGFFTQPGEAPTPINPEGMGAAANPITGELSKEMAPGALDLLPPGVDFKPFVGQYPTEAYGPFVSAVKHDQAAGLDVAHHNFSGDMSAVNYSSARIAELGERDGWRGLSHWFIGAFVETVFAQWLEMALLSGQITLPGGQTLSVSRLEKYLDGVAFRPRGWDWVDPLKEVTAAALARAELFTTTSQVVASKGGDFEDNVAELAQEEQILADAGMQRPGAAAAAAAAAGAQAAAGNAGNNTDTTAQAAKALARAQRLLDQDTTA